MTLLPEETPDSQKVVVLEVVQDAGLGNQLFEYAAMYSIARTLNLPLKVVWRPSKLREFGLKDFGITENPPEEYTLLMARAGQGDRKLYEKAIRLIENSDKKFCGVSCPMQAEECFSDHADEIRELFKLEPFDLLHPAGTTPVGVQVRRGDYISHPRLSVCTPQYFLNALNWMRANVPNPHFFIVSDDPFYCHRLFEKQLDVTVMPTQPAFGGLRTLASCKAHIISNSTFGWWGAWLGESGPVVVPEYWHHMPGSYGRWNPVPDRWIKLPIGQEVRRLETIKPRTVTVLPEPTIERAIVIPWHADQAKWQELRFCLRSIEKHFEDKKCPVLIFGTKRPGFIRGDNPRVHYRGAYTYSEALSNGLQVAKKVAWFNDDCLMLKDTTWEDLAVPYYVRDVGPEFLKNGKSGGDAWREGVLRVCRQLAEMGIKDQKVYSTHLPYLFDRKKSLEVFEKFGVFHKIAFEIPYFHLHPEGSKLLTNERTETLPNTESRFLNFADRNLTDHLKVEIMTLFPNPAEWETMGGEF